MANTIKNNPELNSRITIQDVANALGISKTTVSRAISGKGRIGEETRKKVLDYINEKGYQPSPLAKGLANQRTYNIAWIMPGDSTITDLPFFQRCMTGVIEEATSMDYDVLISMVYEHNNSGLRRIVSHQKVDGVILGRTLVDDENIRFLKESGIPFVVIGSTSEKDVIQVDNDHLSACRELTDILIMKGFCNMVLIGGDDSHVVNQSRKAGYEAAINSTGKGKINSQIYMNADTPKAISSIVDNALSGGCDCIVCMDDRICAGVLERLHHDGIEIPKRIRIASFYNSELLYNNQPAITTLQYDPKELGMTAAKKLFAYIDGQEIERKTYLSYEVLLKGSTL